jgi:hypothetical protein
MLGAIACLPGTKRDAAPSKASPPFAIQTITNRHMAERVFLRAGADRIAGQHLARWVLNGERVVAEEKLLTDFKQRIPDVRQGPDGAVYLPTGAPRFGPAGAKELKQAFRQLFEIPRRYQMKPQRQPGKAA